MVGGGGLREKLGKVSCWASCDPHRLLEAGALGKGFQIIVCSFLGVPITSLE